MKIFLYAVAAVLIIAAAVGLWIIPVTAPADGSLVGMTEPQVRQRLGSPSDSFPGHYGSPATTRTSQFHGEIRTETFSRFGGTVFVSFERLPGGWTAVCNSWLPRGGNF